MKIMKKTLILLIVIEMQLAITFSCIPTGISKAKIIDDDFDIQQAIQNAHNGDIITVPDGTYYEQINFLGKAITVESENGPNNCTINGWNCHLGVKFNTNESADSILQGFTITNCGAEHSAGGGIFCGQYTRPTIINCVITNNIARGIYQKDEARGGGIFCDRFSSPTFLNCQITNNQALGDNNYYACGGGIAADYASPTFIGCLIANNTATFAGGLDGHATGGGISARYGSHPILKNCMIVNNTAESSGGGLILRYGAQATIYGCTFSGNQALEIGWGGGGITCEYGADAVIRNTILWNDYPQEIHINGWMYSTVDIDFCDIQGGEAAVTISEQQPDFDHVIYGDMNLIANPQFKNPGNNDFHITLLSPCVDAGNITYTGELDKDFDGESRVYDIPWIYYIGRDSVDIGADEVCTLIIHGDCNGDKIINIGDVVYLISYLYKNGTAPEPLGAGDVNLDTIVDVGDVVYLINYLFKGGNPPQ